MVPVGLQLLLLLLPQSSHYSFICETRSLLGLYVIHELSLLFAWFCQSTLLLLGLLFNFSLTIVAIEG